MYEHLTFVPLGITMIIHSVNQVNFTFMSASFYKRKELVCFTLILSNLSVNATLIQPESSTAVALSTFCLSWRLWNMSMRVIQALISVSRFTTCEAASSSFTQVRLRLYFCIWYRRIFYLDIKLRLANDFSNHKKQPIISRATSMAGKKSG